MKSFVPEVCLPTFHSDQIRAFNVFIKNKRVVGRCGRRWGKTLFASTIASDYAAKGRLVGWFAPSYRIMAEAYTDIAHILAPVIPKKNGSNKTDGIIRTNSKGLVEFWSLENERAGRSRKYHLVVIDEAAFAKASMMNQWNKAIEPTLLDYSRLPYGGKCLVISNTNGIDADNFFHMICKTQQEKYKFVEFHAPTQMNPHMPVESLEELKASKHPKIWQQEYLADFVDFSSDPFFSEAKLLIDGVPPDYPTECDHVFAVIDTAVKQGKEHDATAVSYWAMMKWGHEPYQIICLDWDLVSIDGALLEVWIKGVFQNLERLAKQCCAIYGSSGAYIEDAQSGSILIQQCELRGYPAQALPSELTAAGKDARAINASGPVYCNRVKISGPAYHKVMTFKEMSGNHLMMQLSSFRVGDKDAAKRSDDLLDTATYAIAITCGDQEGIA